MILTILLLKKIVFSCLKYCLSYTFAPDTNQTRFADEQKIT